MILDRIDCCDCTTAYVIDKLLEIIQRCEDKIIKVFIVIADEMDKFDERNVLSSSKDRLRTIKLDQEIAEAL